MDNGNLKLVLDRLKGVKRSGKGWQALCPAHDDRKQSLSISKGDEKQVLLYCHAGCETESVVEAMGLKMSDLFPPQEEPLKKRGCLTETYDYHDADGKLLHQTVRYAPKGFSQRRPDDNGGWIWSLQGIKPVLYRLPQVMVAIAKGEAIYLVEGEKDADNLRKIGFTATCNPMGAVKDKHDKRWRDSYTEALKSADIVMLPDNDNAGHRHAQIVAEKLYAKSASIKIVNLPGLGNGSDVSDWLDGGGTADELKRLVAEAPEHKPTKGKAESGDKVPVDGKKHEEKPSHSQKLMKMADEAELFHTEDGEAYASFEVNGHRETWSISSKNFKEYLLHSFYLKEGKPPSAQPLQDAIGVLKAKAKYEGPEEKVFTRIAAYDGAIYLDLANAGWEIVEIKPEGWRMMKNASVRFRRTKGMLPLPRPLPGGSIEDLRPLVNLSSDSDWRLFVAWLIGALRPTGPYPILVLQGEQGSAKSTLARIARALVDPSLAPLRTTPRDERDLMIAAKNSWILSFDNLSGIKPWLSDALCRLATGGGFSTRELYSDSDEVIIDAMRPVILNGIHDLATRADLADRSLILSLPPIPDEKRSDEKRLWEELEKNRPRILGALFDAVSTALGNVDRVELACKPRMADFAMWAIAAERALPWTAGAFMEAYTGNRQEAVELTLESDAAIVALRAMLEQRDKWEGTAAELLTELEDHAPEAIRKSRSWPKSPSAMSSRLKRAAPFLRVVGLDIEFYQQAGSGSRKLISVRKRGDILDANDADDAEKARNRMIKGIEGASVQKIGDKIATHLVATPGKECVDSVESDANLPGYSKRSNRYCEELF